MQVKYLFESPKRGWWFRIINSTNRKHSLRMSPKTIGRVIDFENSNLTNQQPHFWREPVTVEFKKKIPKSGDLCLLKESLVFLLLPLLPIFIPPSVGMFPHLFQHWLIKKCQVFSTYCDCSPPLYNGGLGSMYWLEHGQAGYCLRNSSPAVLSAMLNLLVGDPVLIGLLTAGVLAALCPPWIRSFFAWGQSLPMILLYTGWRKEIFR